MVDPFVQSQTLSTASASNRVSFHFQRHSAGSVQIVDSGSVTGSPTFIVQVSNDGANWLNHPTMDAPTLSGSRPLISEPIDMTGYAWLSVKIGTTGSGSVVVTCCGKAGGD